MDLITQEEKYMQTKMQRCSFIDVQIVFSLKKIKQCVTTNFPVVSTDT